VAARVAIGVVKSIRGFVGVQIDQRRQHCRNISRGDVTIVVEVAANQRRRSSDASVGFSSE
jgi:hypothetical protein